MTTSSVSSLSPAHTVQIDSEKILQSVIDPAREGIMIVDAGTRIVASNAAALRVFARENDPLRGKRLSEVIRDLSLHDAFKQAVDRGVVSDVRVEFTGTEKRSYDVRIAPIELEGQRRAVGVFYDVTRVERLERVRQEFLSNISHELRTPLTSIMAYVETLEDGAIDDSENNRRFLAVIRRNAERMKCLISDILELSLIESGNVSIEKRSVDLHHLVDEVFASFASNAYDRSIALENVIEPETRVTADPGRLEQMLTNLIDNAVKFNRSEGSVTARHERQHDRDLIFISDTGEGLTNAHLKRIFERFYRADRGRTREVGGTGLGLAIVKHLARLHGGNVSAESTLDVGTTFTIELPME